MSENMSRKAKDIAACFVATILICGPLLSAIILQPNHEKHWAAEEEPKTENTSQRTIYPVSFFHLITGFNLQIDAKYCSKRPDGDAEKWIVNYWCETKRTDVYSVLSSMVTAFITSALLGVGVLQYHIYRKMRMDSLIANRAFITFKGCSISLDEWCPSTNGHHKIRISINYGNSGATSTRWAVARSSFRITNTDWEPSLVNYADLGEHVPNYILIGGKDTQTVHNFQPGYVHPYHIESGFKVYVWGWLEYNDLFDPTDRHRVEFCNRADVRIDPANPRAMTAYVAFGHGTFNGADDECSRKKQTEPRQWNPEQKWTRAKVADENLVNIIPEMPQPTAIFPVGYRASTSPFTLRPSNITFHSNHDAPPAP